MKSVYLLAANALVVMHAIVVLIVITPLVSLALPWHPPRWLAAIALVAIALTVVSNLLRGECLLNVPERWLRRRAGQVRVYDEPFVEHYAKRMGIKISKQIVAVLVVAAAAASIFTLLS